MKKIAVILAGCGRLDGSEIHESVLTLLSIKQSNGTYQCFSLNQPQNHVSNHLTNQAVDETRNMLVESARIARGAVKDLEDLNVNEFDGLIVPGGNGTAYNLFDFAIKGSEFTVNPKLKEICQTFTKNNKPVGFICIAPVMIAKIYNSKVKLTIGNDKTISALIEKLGFVHQDCAVDDICIDNQHKIVTTPAYMLAENILEAYTGIHKLVKKVIDF